MKLCGFCILFDTRFCIQKIAISIYMFSRVNRGLGVIRKINLLQSSLIHVTWVINIVICEIPIKKYFLTFYNFFKLKKMFLWFSPTFQDSNPCGQVLFPTLLTEIQKLKQVFYASNINACAYRSINRMALCTACFVYIWKPSEDLWQTIQSY